MPANCGTREQDGAAKKAAKGAQAELDRATLKRYGALTEDDIKTLLLDAKWRAAVSGRVEKELTSLVLCLVARLEELGERYGETVGVLEVELGRLASRVIDHLSDMGVA